MRTVLPEFHIKFVSHTPVRTEMTEKGTLINKWLNAYTFDAFIKVTILYIPDMYAFFSNKCPNTSHI